MKLNLLTFAMDLLIVLAYPILIVHGILQQLSRSRKDLAVVKIPVSGPVRTGRSTFRR